MAFTRTFTDTEIMAMAGYQLDPGHSDLDNEQPMAVRVIDGLWDAVTLRCTLGDIRQAKTVVRAALEARSPAGAAAEAIRAIKAVAGMRSSAADMTPWGRGYHAAMENVGAVIAHALTLAEAVAS